MRQTLANAFHKAAEGWSQGARQKRVGTLRHPRLIFSLRWWGSLVGREQPQGWGKSPEPRGQASCFCNRMTLLKSRHQIGLSIYFFFLTGKFFKNPEKQKKLIQWASHNKLYQHFLLTLRHCYFFSFQSYILLFPSLHLPCFSFYWNLKLNGSLYIFNNSLLSTYIYKLYIYPFYHFRCIPHFLKKGNFCLYTCMHNYIIFINT